MADKTAIEWCDATLNLWWGCTKVSDGCKFCYADTLSNRYNRAKWGPKGTRTEVKLWRSTLEKVSKRATKEGKRLKVFVQSMSDTFEGPETMGGTDSENWKTVSHLQDEFFGEIVFEYPHLDFLVLTKRPGHVLSVIHRHDEEPVPGVGLDGSYYKLPDNVWIGTSVEDQKTADERIPWLIQIPAKTLFLSCEPFLGDVTLTSVNLRPDILGGVTALNALTGCEWREDSNGGGEYPAGGRIDWVICGGESGPSARPMNPNHARKLRDQCEATGVPFFFKQWGEWLPWMEFGDAKVEDACEHTKYKTMYWESDQSEFRDVGYPDWQFEAEDDILMGRVGKKAAGRILDGRTWDQFPEGAI